MKLYQQMMKARSEFPTIELDGNVNYATSKGPKAFKYATLPNIINKITPILLRNGIYFTQLLTADGIHLIIYNDEGEKIESTAPVMYSGANPQDWGSAITYTKRYQIASAFGIVAEEDDDASRIKEGPNKPTLTKNSKTYREIKKRISEGKEITREVVAEHYSVDADVLNSLFTEEFTEE